MAVNINVSLSLNDSELDQLAHILGCTVGELGTKLAAYGNAAMEEYVRMFLGQRTFTRGSDMHEYRLFLLVKKAFDGQVPDEQRVSALFQTSLPRSRSLLRSVMAKFQYDLQPEIDATLRTTLESATIENNEYLVTLNSESLVERMNRILGALDGTLPDIKRKQGTVGTYVVSPSSYGRLCEYCGATAVSADG